MSLRLSPKHGLNPSIDVCFYCGADTGELILAGLIQGDVEAPHRASWGRKPCAECQEYMKQGVILISVDESKTTDPGNPYRTGGWAVVKEEALREIITSPQLADQICKQRVAFVPDNAWDMLGLPR